MTRDLANLLVNSADEVWNLYGPTETTVYSLIERIEESEETKIGLVELTRPSLVGALLEEHASGDLKTRPIRSVSRADQDAANRLGTTLLDILV